MTDLLHNYILCELKCLASTHCQHVATEDGVHEQVNMAVLCIGTTVMTHACSDTFFKVDVGSCRDCKY